MDKKLTDSEIVKALEDCVNGNGCDSCKLYSLEQPPCNKYALDLINRLQAENERLKAEKDNLIRTYSECQIANLQEFMHRVENKLANNTDVSMVGYQSVIGDMEETYKEMVGEDK